MLRTVRYGGGFKFFPGKFFFVLWNYCSLHGVSLSVLFYILIGRRRQIVYAFYQKSTKLLITLLVCLVLEFSAMMALVITALPKEVAKGLPPALARIHSAPCIGISQPKEFASLW